MLVLRTARGSAPLRGCLRQGFDRRCASWRSGGVGTKGVPTTTHRLRRGSNKGLNFEKLQGRPLALKWGTIHSAEEAFFSPHHEYASEGKPFDALKEFRAMVKALHAAGIEVLLDVVYNHTAEGNEDGPEYCYRGIDNTTYYLLEQDRQCYRNDSGTGNTLNCGNP